jgi:NAD(P)-dependent dehydrogenase (short-subunit alcohol dehydrogenase family)
VILWGRSEAPLAEAVARGDAAHYFAADLADPDSVERLTSECQALATPIDGFVHCAGVWTPETLVDVDPSTIARHIQSVSIAAALCLRSAVRLMTAGGPIVQIAAASAKPGFSDTALNIMAKRAQDGLAEGLIRELRGTPMRVTTIYPDSIGANDSPSVSRGDAISYDDLATVIRFALEAPASAHIQEIVLTARNSGR